MTSLWRNFSVSVVVNNNWSCLLISAPKVHWRLKSATDCCQTERQIQQDAWGSTCIAPVNNASTRTVCKCLKRNNGHLITLQIWMEWRYRDWVATHEAILKPSSEAQNSFWIINRTGEGKFFRRSAVNKAVPSFTSNLTRVRERWRKTFKLNALSWIVETFFENVSTTKLPWLKAAQFSQFCR